MQQLATIDTTRRQRFAQAFNRLLASFPNAPQADVARMKVYEQALSAQPIEAIERAGDWLAKHAGDFFPSSAKWHERAEIEGAARFREGLHQARSEPWKTECSDCDDTGWVEMQCGGGPACGRTREHAAHSYVIPCLCRKTNRTYQRQREREFAGKGQV